jgi:hypothetical protein
MKWAKAFKHPIIYQLRALLFARRGAKFAQSWRVTPQKAPPLLSSNPLEEYFDSHHTGLGIWKWRHYFEIYHRHLSRFVGTDAHVLEVGIYSGGSLRMWREYFGERAHIYGVDIEPACKAYEGERARIFIGDQASREFWRKLKQDVPLLDILIDDGGHHHEQQIVTLEEILPHLRPGGIYICEDVHGQFNPFQSYVSGLAAHLNSFITTDGLVCDAASFQSEISIHLYPFITVIEKADNPPKQLTSEKHGTQWQPFYDPR